MIARPWWAPSKVFSLPICMRLYRNHQGLTKGKNKQAKRPTKKGERLPDVKSWEQDSSKWSTHHFDQYGLHGSLQTKTKTGLYYTAGKDRLLRFVLTSDTVGDRPTRIFYSTNTHMDVREILSLFSFRWSIEVTHFDCKQHLGLEDAANRTEKSVFCFVR